MEEYIVSARKYRPMSFDTVVGQTALTTTLKNAVKSGKLAHAYLFCGPRGVGKTTCARIFAKAINCQHPTQEGEACNECESCQSFNEQRSYNIFELDAASNNGVEHIKTLMEQTYIPPQVGKYKVFIIDEVHMLSTAAFNAFLKTLEEPPAHVIFVLATTEKHKILPTIISRCQIYDFERMSVQNIVNHLKMVAEKEGVAYEEEALNVIAEKADGGMRDALSVFDQAVSFCQGDVTYAKVIEDLNVLDAENYFKIIDLSLENRVADVMLCLNDILSRGFDGGNLINGMGKHVRNVMMAKDPKTLPLLEVSDKQRQAYQEQAQKCDSKFLYAALKLINQCDVSYRQSSNKRLLVELTLIQIAQITQADDDAAGAGRRPGRLKTLFKQLIASTQSKPASQVAGTESVKLPTSAEKAKAAANVEAINTPSTKTFAVSGQPAAVRRLKIGALGPSFKSQETPQKVDPPVAEPLTTGGQQVAQQENFSQEQLMAQWLGMCNRMTSNPEYKVLGMRMKNITPQITQFPHVEVVCSNQQLYDELNAVKERIQLTLSKGLANKELSLNLRLAEQSELKPILTPQQCLEELKKANPMVEKLCKTLKLDLA